MTDKTAKKVKGNLSLEMYDEILGHLEKNKGFRGMFFKSPRKALKKVGINASKKFLITIERVDWTKNIDIPADFDDENVPRCAMDY